MLPEIISRVLAFRDEANRILSVYESSASRVIELQDTYSKLGQLSLEQDELIRQSLRCVEHGLYRAAHVMAWAGFMDFLEEKLGSDGMTKLSTARPNWPCTTVEELRERVPEHQLIEATRAVGLCRRNQVRALLGLLNKRNECAHPSDYYPGLNETLGYISELLQRIEHLKPIQF